MITLTPMKNIMIHEGVTENLDAQFSSVLAKCKQWQIRTLYMDFRCSNGKFPLHFLIPRDLRGPLFSRNFT